MEFLVPLLLDLFTLYAPSSHWSISELLCSAYLPLKSPNPLLAPVLCLRRQIFMNFIDRLCGLLVLVELLLRHGTRSEGWRQESKMGVDIPLTSLPGRLARG